MVPISKQKINQLKEELGLNYKPSEANTIERQFIVWTFRRTGGTAFHSGLESNSRFSGTQHEPFNSERKFGHILEAWQQGCDAEFIDDELDKIFSQKMLIKHCLDIIPQPINIRILERSLAHGYQHIILSRNDHTQRLLSLHFFSENPNMGKTRILRL